MRACPPAPSSSSVSGSVAWRPKRAAIASRRSLERAAGALLARRQLGDHERRGDAVLVAHDVGHGVAERLLVAEQQPVVGQLRDGAHDPLEAGQRLGVRAPDGLGHPPEQRGRGDRRHEQGARADRRACSSRKSASSAPISSPCSAPPAAAGRGWRRRAGRRRGRWPAARSAPRRARPRPARGRACPAPPGWAARRWGSRGRARPGRRPRAARGKPGALERAPGRASRPTPCSGV